MLKKIQQRFLRKLTDKNLNDRDTSNLNDAVKTLGFLVDEELFSDFERLYAISEKMGLQRKDVKIFTFMQVKKKTPSLRQNQINNKHFTWKGEIHNQSANEFLEMQSDVLVGYYNSKNNYLDVMMSNSKAKFKVGFSETDKRLFDLIIKEDPLQVDRFGNELIKYLKVLNKI